MAFYFDKIKDWLMPPEEEYVEEVVEKIPQKMNSYENVKSANEKVEKIAVNEVVPRYSSSSRFSSISSGSYSKERLSDHPKFKLQTASAPSLNMEVHVPQSFDQVRSIGDQLKRKNAVVVNYEMLPVHDQIRICDFLSGLTYVLDGDIKRISNNIVLYVPKGVDVSDAVMSVA